MRVRHGTSKPTWHSWLTRIFLFSLLWFAIAGLTRSAVVAGIPIILLSTFVSVRVLPEIDVRWLQLPRFILYFIKNSFLGAIDVSTRALSPSLPLDPDLHTHTLSLPKGFARVVYMNSISLLPGTLSADIQDDTLTIHLLDASPKQIQELEQLEALILQLFGREQQPSTHAHD